MAHLALVSDATAPASTLNYMPFSQIGVAPENLRFKEPADAGIPRLADTIAAVGILVPLLVRAGGAKDAKPTLALDGRRRLFALTFLEGKGVVTPEYLVPVIFSEDKAAQVAATVVANDERVAIHIADVIVAIGKLRKRRYDTAMIAAALAYSEVEVKRLGALSALDSRVIDALRSGKMTLRQARLVARIPEKEAQRHFADLAIDASLSDHRLLEFLGRGRTDTGDLRLKLVGLDRYVAAGGRTEGDLFGEMQDTLSDPQILDELWVARVQPIIIALKAQGISGFTAATYAYEAPDGFERLPYGGKLSDDQAAAIKAIDVARAAARPGQAIALEAEEAIPEFMAHIEADLARVAIAYPSRAVGAVVLFPSRDWGLGFQAFLKPMPEVIAGDADEADDGAVGSAESDDRDRPQIEVPRAEVDVEGQSNLCHETQTDMATRGLMRDLADNPAVALTALIAQLFKTLVLVCRMVGDSALDIKAAPYEGKRRNAIESLDGDVWARIDARKDAYTASGLRPIPWIETLAYGERMALLAELVAVSLNVREDRKDTIRHAARAEAAEIAELCSYDIAQHWTPNEAYLSIHSKAQLLAMLGEMRRDDLRAGLFKKGELVAFVAETAAELRFAPATLAWRRAADGEAAESTPPESATDTEVV